MENFEQITRDFHKPTRNKSHPALGCGVLLLLLATLSLIMWGFGLDRFAWIAAGTGAAGVVLATIGAITGKKQ